MTHFTAEGEDEPTETFYSGGNGISFTEPDDEVLIWPHQETLGHMIQARKGLYLNPQGRQGPFDVKDRWTYTVDNAFALAFFKRIHLNGLYEHYQDPTTSQLCETCKTSRIMAERFERVVRVSDLKDMGKQCELCKMIWQSVDSTVTNGDEVVRIHRKDSNLWVKGRDRPIMRVCAGLKALELIQIGFPALPDVRSDIHFELIREWLRVCDRDHADYGCRPGHNPRLPTRVLQVGNHSTPLHLHCAKPNERGRYLALSHCWGKLPSNVKEMSCTYRRNFEDRCVEIDISTLPRNFQDAILVTRKLGIQYIWVDSLCIIQDDLRDWEKEAKLMEQVFSSAYCTIAASSAKDSTVGFLSAREPAPFVRVPYTSKSCLFVCEAIDDFHRDVGLGELNTRAWVLQERALSRRTLHFTKTQTYWECGRGIHCESMTKLNNLRTRLLADPRFPSTIQENIERDRIRFVNWIIELYTKLALSFNTDRPKAFFGIETRLSRTLRTKSYHGVLESNLHRGLLWQRPPTKELNRIAFAADRNVPSWSWMAHDGEVKFMDIPFGGVEWSDGVRWHKGENESGTPSEAPVTEIEGLVREFSFTDGVDGVLFFDDHNKRETADLRIVIIGRVTTGGPPDHEEELSSNGVDSSSEGGNLLRDVEDRQEDTRGPSSNDQEYYVLLVQPVHIEDRKFERAGVGTISKRHIVFERPALKSRVI